MGAGERVRPAAKRNLIKELPSFLTPWLDALVFEVLVKASAPSESVATLAKKMKKRSARPRGLPGALMGTRSGYLLGALLEDFVGEVVLDLGLVLEFLEVGFLEQLHAAVVQGCVDGLLDARVV